ncbi:MAG: hypothetical protein Q8O67_31390 [Deltaproteobacteria bacterium]|nr:hypothetical protein [Deltaproteobacteria bacterium]
MAVDPEDDRACPPSCASGFVCVHHEWKRAGVCRPTCSPTTFDIVGVPTPARVDPRVVERGAQVEPFIAMPN